MTVRYHRSCVHLSRPTYEGTEVGEGTCRAMVQSFVKELVIELPTEVGESQRFFFYDARCTQTVPGPSIAASLNLRLAHCLHIHVHSSQRSPYRV